MADPQDLELNKMMANMKARECRPLEQPALLAFLKTFMSLCSRSAVPAFPAAALRVCRQSYMLLNDAAWCHLRRARA